MWNEEKKFRLWDDFISFDPLLTAWRIEKAGWSIEEMKFISARGLNVVKRDMFVDLEAPSITDRLEFPLE